MFREDVVRSFLLGQTFGFPCVVGYDFNVLVPVGNAADIDPVLEGKVGAL
jgi:hypothetical protein